MIPTREPYKIFFKIFNFLGFWDELPKWHKRIVTGLMIICSVLYTLIITLPIFQQDDLIDVLNVLKIAPMLIMVVINLYDFIRKKSKIREILELIEELESENSESKSYFDDAFKLIYNIFLVEAIFLTLFICSFVVTPLIIDKLMFPSYMPDIIKDYRITFYIYWMFENVSAIYCTIVYIQIQEFRCSLLLILNNYMEFFRMKLRNLHATKENVQEAKIELVNCVKIHHQIMK